MAESSSSRRIRHECKFVVPRESVLRVEAMLEHHCVTDPSFHANVIKSLYFDSEDMALLRQKQASEFLKRKVRIRWYTDPGTGQVGPHAFLEVKAKQGANGGKQRINLDTPADEFDRDPIAAVRGLCDHAAEPVQGLEPVCVVQYLRRRYIDMATGFRLALDTAIRCTSVNRSLFRGMRESRPTCAVLEVKGSGARTLPPSLSRLHEWGVQKAAFSKYAACLDGEHPLETDPR